MFQAGSGLHVNTQEAQENLASKAGERGGGKRKAIEEGAIGQQMMRQLG
jgi:hypothetical protein